MDELSLLQEMRNKTAGPTDAAIERGRSKLLQRLDPNVRTASPKIRHSRRSFMRVGISAVATLAVLAALIGGDIVGFAGWRGAATAQAAEVLNDAALATIQSSDPVVGPGQYWKIQSTNVWATTWSPDKSSSLMWLDTEKDTMYVPADHNDEWLWQRSARVPTTFFDEKSKAFALSHQRAVINSQTQLLRARNGAFYGPADDSTAPSAAYLAAFPRDPYRLLNNIYKRTLGQGQSMDGEALVFVADLLRTGIVPADLRAALYKAAALIPGVTISGHQATLYGHTGIAIGRVEAASHSRQDIIIDPTTGRMIGEREVIMQAQGAVPAGTATTWTAIETSVSTAP